MHWKDPSRSGVCSEHHLEEASLLLGISCSRLSTSTTIIYGFKAGSSHPLGKIRLRYQIGDLKSEVTCYIIDADTSYNLLLGQSWIHANWIVPSILHHCSKYVGDDDVVRMVFNEMQPPKEVENYFTDSLPYQESNKPVKELLPIDVDIFKYILKTQRVIKSNIFIKDPLALIFCGVITIRII